MDNETEKFSTTKSSHEVEIKKDGPCYVKARSVLAFMGFLAVFNMYALRANLSVAIVAMVNHTEPIDDVNVTMVGVCPDRTTKDEMKILKSGQYEWDTAQQGLLLGCYYYGYILFNIPGGWLANKFGMKIVLGSSMMASGILTIASPLAASYSFELLVALRILLGVLQGTVSPCMHGAWGKWAPPMERSTLVAVYMSGASVGTFATLSVGGILAERLGWESVFYFTGGLAFLCSVIWIGIIHDTPEKHPRISEYEKRFLLESIDRTKPTKIRPPTPWWPMLTSISLWAITVAKFSEVWVLYTLNALLPTYMSNILRMNLATSGVLSSIPYVMQWIFVVSGGFISDMLIRKMKLRIIFVRKLNTTLGLAIPGVCIVLAGYVGCDAIAAVVFFTLAVGFNALAVSGCNSNPVDISPNFAGIVYAIANTFSSTSGFLSPQIYGLILLEDNSMAQWHTVFWSSGVIGISGAVFYLIFASADRHIWDKGSETETDFELKKEKDEKI